MFLHGWQKEERLQSLMPLIQQGCLFAFIDRSLRVTLASLICHTETKHPKQGMITIFKQAEERAAPLKGGD